MTIAVVTKVIQREDPIVTINGVLKSAPDEVVYLANGATEAAGHLKIGDRLLSDSGNAVAVTTITHSPKLVKTYDFATKNSSAFFADGYMVQSLSSLSE